jgi:hypothetical protein
MFLKLQNPLTTVNASSSRAHGAKVKFASNSKQKLVAGGEWRQHEVDKMAVIDCVPGRFIHDVTHATNF